MLHHKDASAAWNGQYLCLSELLSAQILKMVYTV